MNKDFNALVDKLTRELAETLKQKNADYGDSFAKQFRKYGVTSAMIRIEDKFNRLENLVNPTKTRLVENESIEDTLLDLAGYAVLTLIERNRGEK